jgi:hypothetical protein
MEKHIIRAESVSIGISELLSALRMEEITDEILSMREEAQAIARPVALYAVCTPAFREDGLKLNGVCLPEPFIRKMLTGCDPVLPYAASCGPEIDNWAGGFTDMLAQYIADSLKQLCLTAAMNMLFAEAHSRYYDAEKNISTLNPGSLPEWPLSGQAPLFQILGGVTEDIGVTLSESLLMTPNKSVSGIMFQAAEDFHNCQLCPRPDCPGRRVPYIGE